MTTMCGGQKEAKVQLLKERHYVINFVQCLTVIVKISMASWLV